MTYNKNNNKQEAYEVIDEHDSFIVIGLTNSEDGVSSTIFQSIDAINPRILGQVVGKNMLALAKNLQEQDNNLAQNFVAEASKKAVEALETVK